MDDLEMATGGLFAAWVVHDAEEWLTMARTSGGPSQRHVEIALALMGTVVAAGAIAGRRTGGRSALYRGGLLGSACTASATSPPRSGSGATPPGW